MAVIIHECEQNTPEWHQLRLGLVTASKFATILGVRKDSRDKVTRDKYLRELAGEVLTREPAESFTNQHTERGHLQEAEARDMYALLADVEPERVGFIVNGPKGCSPDSLIGTDGGLEIKSALAHIQIDRLVKGELPPEHRAQVQGNIWIAERSYWDFVSYCPKLPLLVVRVQRDDGYIATLSGAVNAFNEELAALVALIRRYGAALEQAAA